MPQFFQSGAILRATLFAVLSALLIAAFVFYAESADTKHGNSITPEHWRQFSADDLEAALESGELSPNAKVGKFSILLQAVTANKADHFRVLMKHGANVNATTIFTPLHIAALYGRVEMMQALLDKNANPNAQADVGGTPLDYVLQGLLRSHITENQWEEVANLLLKNGADINAVSEGFTPLYYAIRTCDARIVKFFLNNGAKTHVAGQHKTVTPMMIAMLGDPKLISVLVDGGADVNRISKSGVTPLKAAVAFNSIDSVRALMDAGADINLSARGTALQFAEWTVKDGYESYNEISKVSDAGFHRCDARQTRPKSADEHKQNAREIVNWLMQHGAERDDKITPEDIRKAVRLLLLIL